MVTQPGCMPLSGGTSRISQCEAKGWVSQTTDRFSERANKVVEPIDVSGTNEKKQMNGVYVDDSI
jgi:hypothetical protein